MDLQIKICGVRTAGAARACVASGADLVGFNFVASSRRFIAPADARLLVEVVDASRSVGVFVDEDPAAIERARLDSGVTWVQLHGSEPPELCAALRARGLRVIKALAVTPTLTRRRIGDYAAVTDLLLFDAPTPGGGKPFDCAPLRALAPPHRFLLAGGLTPDNVAERIRVVQPDGVDTASGVEVDRHIDPARVAAFCGAARSARKA